MLSVILPGSKPEVVERLDTARADGIGLSTVSLGEWYEGVFYSLDPPGSEKALLEFLRGLEIVELDDEVCRLFGRERGRLCQSNRMVGDFDLLIAASALRHDFDSSHQQPQALRTNPRTCDRKHSQLIAVIRANSVSVLLQELTDRDTQCVIWAARV